MKNIALVFYLMTAQIFNGWQISEKRSFPSKRAWRTRFFHLLKQKVHVSGVGRTDSGVHARRYVANFHADLHDPDGPSAVLRSTAFCPRTLRFPAQSRFPRTSMRASTAPKRNTPIICFLPPCGTRSTRGTHIGTIIRWILQKCRKAHSILSASRTLHP